MKDAPCQSLPGSRSEIISARQEARSRAHSGKRVAILLYGPAGIGKSTLVETAFTDMETSLYGWGKGEQFGSTHPYRPLIEAIGEAVERWLLLAAPTEVEQLQARMQDFEDVLAALLPSFSSLWGMGTVPTPPSHDHRHRVPFALRALVAALASVAPPLVLVLDDLQWVDDETLRRVERGLADPELQGVLGVFCCRDERAAIKRAQEFLSRLGSDGVETLQLCVYPLTDEEIAHLTSDRLGRSVEDVAPLVQVVCQRSGGSPLYVHHAIEYLAAGGTLEARAANGDILELLTHRMANFSEQEREALGLAACAGNRTSVDLLVRAAAKVLPGLDISAFFQRAEEIGLVTLSLDRRLLGMSHDRVQEACAGSPTRWPARHLALWEAGLVGLNNPENLPDEQLFWLVDRQSNASSLLLEHPQKQLAIELALTASRRARLRAAVRVAQRSSALAQRLLSSHDPDPLRGAVLVEHAVTSWLTGDLANFELLSQDAECLATPLQFVPVTELRLQASIARGELSLAVNMALSAARRLLPSIEISESPTESHGKPLETHWSEPRHVDRLLFEFRHLQPHGDPTLEAVSRLLSTAHAAAYVGDPSRLPDLLQTEIELARSMGAASTFPITLAFWGALLATRLSTLGQALEVGRLALSLAAPGSDGLVRARTADMVYGMVLCWQGDLRDTIEPLRANSELAASYGTFEYAGYSLLKSFSYRLFTGASLPELARDLEAGHRRIVALGQTRIARYFERDAAVLRQLLRPSSDPSGLSDGSFELEKLTEELRASNDGYGLLYTATSRLLLAVVFEQWEAGQNLAAEAEKLRMGGPGLAHQAMLSWLSALAHLAGSTPVEAGALQIAEQALSHLDAVAKFGPTVWLPRAALVRAELARHRGHLSLAEQAYQEALEAAKHSRLLLDQYLICARRALLKPDAHRSWRLQAQTALQLWRGEVPHRPWQEPSVSHEALHHAASLATATTLETLGSSLIDILWPEISHTQGRVAGPRGQTLASWNGGQTLGQAEIDEVLGSGKMVWKSDPQRRGFSLCAPILAAETAGAAIYILDSGHDQRPTAALLSLVETAGTLAGVALKSLGMGVKLGWAENELADREALYSTLIQENPAGLFARDREGRVILANKAYAQMTGLPLHELLGRRLYDILPAALAEERLHSDQIALQEARLVDTIEISQSQSGTPKEYVTLRVPLRDRQGQIVGVCGVSTDVTELRRAREEAERSRRLRALGDFAAKIAHDVNNLVTVINFQVELLEPQLCESSQAQENLATISLAASQASDLANQILTFGHPRAGSEEFLLSDVAQECCRLLQATLPPGVSLSSDWQEETAPIKADRLALSQALNNLLANAVHALPPTGGTIHLAITTHWQKSGEPNPLELSEGVYQVLSVQDNGCGMDAQTLRSAFDPFFTTKPQGKGTGLGLSIVHGVIKANGGELSVVSHLGEGTTFHLYFPALSP